MTDNYCNTCIHYYEESLNGDQQKWSSGGFAVGVESIDCDVSHCLMGDSNLGEKECPYESKDNSLEAGLADIEKSLTKLNSF